MLTRYKITIIGDGNVGKTSIRRKFAHKKFNPKYIPTLGVDISIVDHILDFGNYDTKVRLHIWDIAGQQNFASIRNVYLKNSSVILIVFDMTRSTSSISKWIDEIEQVFCSGHIELGDFSHSKCPPILLIGNKADKISSNQNSNFGYIDIQNSISSKNSIDKIIGYIETSAKTGLNVDVSFDLATRFVVMYQHGLIGNSHHSSLSRVHLGSRSVLG